MKSSYCCFHLQFYQNSVSFYNAFLRRLSKAEFRKHCTYVVSLCNHYKYKFFYNSQTTNNTPQSVLCNSCLAPNVSAICTLSNTHNTLNVRLLWYHTNSHYSSLLATLAKASVGGINYHLCQKGEEVKYLKMEMRQ